MRHTRDIVALSLASLLLFFVLFFAPQIDSSDVNIGQAAHPLYSGFAVPISTFSPVSNVAFDSSSAQRSISFSVNDTAVYKIAYVKFDGQPWVQVQLVGNAYPDSTDFIYGSATGIVAVVPSDFRLTSSRLQTNNNYIVIYTYTWSGSWLNHDGWQIRQFNAAISQQVANVPNSAKIVGVWASDYQPDSNYVSRNTLDGDFGEESRWSAEGDDQWIAYALNQTATVSYVRIAFYYTTQRYFDIQYSVNNITWYDTTAKGLTSAANMASVYQTFGFTPVAAKYIRFVGHGSSMPSLWNSIVEMDINGFPVSLPAAPSCTSESSSITCSGKCGTQTNNCGMSVNCGACVTASTGAVIVYKNNFEQRPLGKYATAAEFNRDWNSGWGDRGEFLEVVSDPKGASNKVGMVTYPFYDVKDFKYVCWGDSRCGDSEGKRLFFSSWSQVPNQNLNGGILNGVGPGSGGGQWEIQLPAGPDHGGYKELYLSYRIKFSDGFNAVDGGKLPGLCGADSASSVCPGGGTNTLNSNGDAFRFSARMMFKPDYPMYYMYYPNRNGAGTDNGYGDGLSWSKNFNDGQWHTIVQRIVLNDLNSNNGVVEAWLDGERVASQGGYAFRIGSQTLFGLNRVYFSTFFGGDDRRCTDAQVSAGTSGCARYSDGTNYLWYAPRKTEKAYFDNIVVYYYDASSSVTRGNQVSSASRVEWPPSI